MTTQNQQPDKSDPRQNPPQPESPAADSNTQLYGESGQNVQAEKDSSKSANVLARVRAKIPYILWVPLLPIVAIIAIYTALDEFNPIPKRWRASGLFGLVQIVVGAVLAAAFINTFIFQSYEVVGDSMQPTLQNGDRLIINKLGKSWDSLWRSEYTPKRGDIIVFDDPNGSNRQLVKRVIGLGGDRVVIEKGVITVFNDENPAGFNPDESYADSLAIDNNYSLSTTVTEGNLFVAGDNRIGGASFDSRNDLGLVDTDLVVGDLVLRLLPLSESRFF